MTDSAHLSSSAPEMPEMQTPEGKLLASYMEEVWELRRAKRVLLEALEGIPCNCGSYGWWKEHDIHDLTQHTLDCGWYIARKAIAKARNTT